MEHKLSVLFENKRRLQNSRSKKYAAGKTIIKEGDSINNIYYIDSGFVKVYTHVGAGNQRIAFIYKPGEVFPLTTYLSSTNIARFFYESITPVQVCVLNSRKFQKKVKGDFTLGEEIVQYSRSFDQRFLDHVNDLVAPDDALNKMIKGLTFLIGRAGNGSEEVRIDLPLSIRDLGGISGLNLNEAHQQITHLKNKGIIIKSKSIVINKTKLNALKQKS